MSAESEACANIPGSASVLHGSDSGFRCDAAESFRIRVLSLVEENNLMAVGKSPESWKRVF